MKHTGSLQVLVTVGCTLIIEQSKLRVLPDLAKLTGLHLESTTLSQRVKDLEHAKKADNMLRPLCAASPDVVTSCLQEFLALPSGRIECALAQKIKTWLKMEYVWPAGFMQHPMISNQSVKMRRILGRGLESPMHFDGRFEACCTGLQGTPPG